MLRPVFALLLSTTSVQVRNWQVARRFCKWIDKPTKRCKTQGHLKALTSNYNSIHKYDKTRTNYTSSISDEMFCRWHTRCNRVRRYWNRGDFTSRTRADALMWDNCTHARRPSWVMRPFGYKVQGDHFAHISTRSSRAGHTEVSCRLQSMNSSGIIWRLSLF